MQRNYTLPDLTVLQRAQVFHDLFLKDIAQFQAAFPKFTNAYADDFQDAIHFADSLLLDEQVTVDIAALTYLIKKKLTESITAMYRFYGYAKIGYEGDRSELMKLGYGELAKARINAGKMVELLELAYRRAEEPDIKAVLNSTGFTQADIDALATLASELDSKIEERTDARTNRYKLTSERIAAFNKVWEYMREISNACKVVYYENSAKLWEYRLYAGRKPKKKGK